MSERSGDPPVGGKTLEEHSREYLDHLRSLNYSPRTIEDMFYTLRRLLAWLKDTYLVTTPDRIRKKHLDAWHYHVCGTRNLKGYPIKPTTINKQGAFVRGFLLHLAARGYVLKSLLDVLRRVKEPSTLPSSVLSHAHVRKLLRKISTNTPEGYRNRTILELLYTSGMRARELIGLDVGDVDLDRGTALVHGKGNKERVVPIGKTALRYLRNYVTAVRPFLVRDRTEMAIFVNHLGRRYAYHSLQDYIQATRERLGFPDHVTAHTFRRSCTTEMIRGGANVYHVKELLGHETLRTLKHYARLTIVDLKKTHEKCHPRERDESR